MVHTLKQRVIVTFVVTALAAAVGAGCGYLEGGAITLLMTKRALVQYALRICDTVDAFAGEERTLMAAVNASPYPYCSDAEIVLMRNLLYRSEYLQDAGRIRDGKIDCSATLGRLDTPYALPQPNNTGADGNKVYRFAAPNQAGKVISFAVQLGNSYVVTSDYVLAHLSPTPLHYTTTATDIRSGRVVHLRGESPDVNLQLFAREGTVRINNTFYVTRCSAHNYFTCSTAYISVSEALRADRARIAIYMILSGLTGAFLGLAGFILYRRNHSLEQQLRRAIRKDKLRLVYQPIVALPGRQIAGAEALVRWTDEEGFAVNPEVFVKIAEERGFVREITRTVVRNALRDFGEILRTHPDFRLSINVAAADLTDPGFLPMLDRSLERSGIAASKLIVEITESSTALHEEAIETTRQLRRRGHRVHIDDFGTGYSSLSYLQDLSVDAIKIDRTFTQAIGTEAVTVSILPQILAMAEALDLDVIVEGVETVEQASYFADARRPVMAQGWLFGRPVSAEEFHRILTEREKIATASVDAA